jgi:hypothetical protein
MGMSESENRRPEKQMFKIKKKAKRQTMIYKTLHRKLKIEQHEPSKTKIPGMNSYAQEG